MIFTDSVTVINYHEVNYVGSWHKTEFDLCQWTKKRNTTVAPNGVINYTDNIIVTIKNKRSGFLPDNQYKALSDVTGYWTLSAKTQKDYIVYGVFDEEITEDFTIEDVKRYFQAGLIVQVADNTIRDMLPHYRSVLV